MKRLCSTVRAMLTSTRTGVLLLGLSFLIAGCPAPGQTNQRDHRASSPASVNPNACGEYAAVDAGRKLKAFLVATVQLHRAVKTTEEGMYNTCKSMANELGLPATGDTRTLCNNVIATIKSNLSTGLKAQANLKVDYQPAVCTVDVDAAVQATAACEARAAADVQVMCDGHCTGTCTGRCDGTCAGAAGAAGASGDCNGQCDGVCQGSCTGGCDGYADVQADASCEAAAEIQANCSARCTEPEVVVDADAGIVVDPAKIEATARALRVGLPRMLMIQARIKGPVRRAFTTWSATALNLVGAGGQIVEALGDEAKCVLKQVIAAAGLLADIRVSVDVQVEVSAQVSASAGGG